MSFLSGNQKVTGLLGLLFIVLVWGSASSVTKLAVEDMPPYVFAFLRNLVASIGLLPFYLVRKKKGFQQPGTPPFKKILWLALTGITFFYLFFNISLYYTTAAAGALIQGFIPVAIILLAIIFLKERLRALQMAGILLSVCGVVMIGFVGIVADGRNYVLGNVLMIVAVLCWGAYTIISKSMQKYDPVYLVTMSTWIGTACLVPAVVIELWNKPALPVITGGGWAAIVYLGLLSSSICYMLYSRVLQLLPAVQVGNLMNLDPVIGAVIAVIVLNESVTVWQVSGAVLVLLGVVLTSVRDKGNGKEPKS
jgi:drug/metabolite transporter (DMT)-like permease